MTKIKELRKLKNLTQTGLADMLGLSQDSISKYELGKSYPDIETAMRMAIVFDVTLDELLEFKKVYDKLHGEINKKISGDHND